MITLLAAAITLPGRAGTITLSPSNAEATLTSAETGRYGAQNGTPKASDLNTLFGSSWISAGQRTSDGTSGFLTTDVTSGNWSSKEVYGTWAISPSFWSTYSSAIISIHVGGNLSSNVTWFAWTITPATTSGTWGYENENRGGGFSNMELWGSGSATSPVQPQNVIVENIPDAGSTLALMGLALFSLGFASRKSKR